MPFLKDRKPHLFSKLKEEELLAAGRQN